MKKLLALLLLFVLSNSFSQTKKIRVLSSDYFEADEKKYPGATILIGNVKIAHEGVILDCKQALLYKKENLFKALGEVVIEQGDSIIQYSDFAVYNANTKKAVSWGNVEINDREMKLSTDTLYFDRKKQVVYYQNKGSITDKKNILKSVKGSYYLKEKKFSAQSKVTITNPDNYLVSDHLDYYTNTRLVYLYGPSTITNVKDNTKIYAERGFYDTNTEVSFFVKRAKLFLKDKRTIAADSLYYDKRKGFASATNNIKVVDPLQNMVAKGNYAEVFEQKDSLFMTDRAVAIYADKKDSMYVHGDKILVTGKSEKRIVRIFNRVKVFKSNLRGKCDSIHTSQITGVTRMFKNPVLWSGKNQITGDHIQLLSNRTTHKLDSLHILQHAFIIQKDSLAEDRYNQIKGRNIYGKFINNHLKTLLVKGNAESLYYNRNNKTLKLETVTKEIASDIAFTLENNEIVQTKYIKKSEGKTFPPSKFPENEEKFKGFIWRGHEQPLTMEDIFNDDDALPKMPRPAHSTPKILNAKKQLLKQYKTQK